MGKGEIPPDICVEISLWDRFGWSRRDTDVFTLQELRLLFGVLEQQRVSKDAVENFGKPDPKRIARQAAAADRAKNNKTVLQDGAVNPNPTKNEF